MALRVGGKSGVTHIRLSGTVKTIEQQGKIKQSRIPVTRGDPTDLDLARVRSVRLRDHDKTGHALRVFEDRTFADMHATRAFVTQSGQKLEIVKKLFSLQDPRDRINSMCVHDANLRNPVLCGGAKALQLCGGCRYIKLEHPRDLGRCLKATLTQRISQPRVGRHFALSFDGAGALLFSKLFKCGNVGRTALCKGCDP